MGWPISPAPFDPFRIAGSTAPPARTSGGGSLPGIALLFPGQGSQYVTGHQKLGNVGGYFINHYHFLVGGFSPTPLEHMLVKLGIFPR